MQLRQRLTYRTKCDGCKKPVLAHSNGNGDFVLLELPDSPGEWEVHGCYAAGQKPKAQPREAKRPVEAEEVGHVARNGAELEIVGRVVGIRAFALSQTLRRLQPHLRDRVFTRVTRECSEMQIVVKKQTQFTVFADLRQVVAGQGDLVRVVAERVQVEGVGKFFVAREVSLVKALSPFSEFRPADRWKGVFVDAPPKRVPPHPQVALSPTKCPACKVPLSRTTLIKHKPKCPGLRKPPKTRTEQSKNRGR